MARRKRNSEKGETEAEGSAAEEAGESKAEEKAEKKAGEKFADGGIASARDKLNLKPTPGDEGPANDKRDHPMSASMKSALKGYPNL